jgi:hypothetical protein
MYGPTAGKIYQSAVRAKETSAVGKRNSRRRQFEIQESSQ